MNKKYLVYKNGKVIKKCKTLKEAREYLKSRKDFNECWNGFEIIYPMIYPTK